MKAMTLEQAVRQKLMISFEGLFPPAELLVMLHRQPVGGITLFRHLNVQEPEQVRELTSTLQQVVRSAGHPPLLFGVDQEGGQLMAIGSGATPFPGNLALGATGSTDLACQTGRAIGRELAAMGINVNYAPVCDVNLNPLNPAVGTRSFGEDPAAVASLSAAMVAGIQSAGVAATAKHFPGHGDSVADPHFAAPVSALDEGRWRRFELPPFAAALEAGVRLVMASHVALPAFNRGKDLPTTISSAVLRGLLRGELGFEDLIISDAMDMEAIQQGGDLAIDAIAAMAAGVDLLLLKHTPEEVEIIYRGLLHAARRALLAEEDMFASAQRVLALKTWLEGAEQPPIETVGCAEHQALALEIASRSVTLVRDTARLLPLRLPAHARVATIVPVPEDLTPADTSSYLSLSLAQVFRRYHPDVDEFVVPVNPADADISAIRKQARNYDLIIVATINSRQYGAQAALVNSLLESGVATITVAMRMPDDLLVYPAAPTYICTYSILPPAVEALAEALWGLIPFQGRSPISIPGN
jgi:beta-N-acetylhexosaminidase